MALKLLALDVSLNFIRWIIDFLVNRSQSVCFQHALSDSRTTSTGSPQGTVLSPVLFTLYTNDCIGTNITPVIKYSDDTAIEDLSNSDSIYMQEVERFTTWCDKNYLELNVKKTKELVIDFRRNPNDIPDLVIKGEKVERVSEYKYLGVVIDNKLTFTANTNAIHKKCQSRLYCLQKLRSLQVGKGVLQTFYRSFIESLLTFGFMCWFGGLGLGNKTVLERMVRVCSRVVGERQRSLNQLYECRVKRKAKIICKDKSHVLAKYYSQLPSGRRYRMPKVKSLRARNSFLPFSISLLNRN